jgi:NAD(P)-dependent dehydrogenase (short-subunit alcohol dehydrogenase family)
MTEICKGRVAVVTGGGRGIGREHALMLARHGAKVVVNDLGGSLAGEGADTGAASEVVEEIQLAGGDAYADRNDVATHAGAQALIDGAIRTYGALDILINNAGILRDRTLVSMEESEWDEVIRVHLKGTFGPSHFAARYWRGEAKAGRRRQARIVNTTSPSGIYGKYGQTNYGAAKAGIAGFTVIAAKELGGYGVTVNALAPVAYTRMTQGGILEEMPPEERELFSPHYVAAVACWLASTESDGVTGRVFDVSGQKLSVVDGWHRGPTLEHPSGQPGELGVEIMALVQKARPNAAMDGCDEQVAR